MGDTEKIDTDLIEYNPLFRPRFKMMSLNGAATHQIRNICKGFRTRGSIATISEASTAYESQMALWHNPTRGAVASKTSHNKPQ